MKRLTLLLVTILAALTISACGNSQPATEPGAIPTATGLPADQVAPAADPPREGYPAPQLDEIQPTPPGEYPFPTVLPEDYDNDAAYPSPDSEESDGEVAPPAETPATE